MTRLSKEQLLLMHEQVIDRYGGSHGVRDEGLLDLNHIEINMTSKDWRMLSSLLLPATCLMRSFQNGSRIILHDKPFLPPSLPEGAFSYRSLSLIKGILPQVEAHLHSALPFRILADSLIIAVNRWYTCRQKEKGLHLSKRL